METDHWRLAAIGLSAALLAAAGLLAVGLSFAPFEAVKSRADAFASDGRAELFTAAVYPGIVLRLRVAGSMLVLAAGLGYLGRRRLAKEAWEMLSSLGSLAGEAKQEWSAALKREERLHLGAAAAILATAVAGRLIYLFQPMRFDESLTYIRFASKPLYLIVTDYSAPNNHVLHTILVHLTTVLLGNHPWAIRIPAALAGVLAVPAAYLAARLHYDKGAALLAGGLVAASSTLIEFSTNARGYTLICLFFLTLVSLAPVLRRHGQPAVWLLFAVVTALGFFTVPIMLYPFGLVLTWLLLSAVVEERGPQLRLALRDLLAAMVAAFGLSFVLYLPIFTISGAASVFSNNMVTSLDWPELAPALAQVIPATLRQWSRDIPAAIQIALGLGFLTALIYHRRLSAHRVGLVTAAALWLPFAVIVQRVAPEPRIWLFLLPLGLVAASAGITYWVKAAAARLGRRPEAAHAILAVGAALLLLASAVRSQSITYSGETGALRDAEGIAVFLAGTLAPGDRVLAIPPSDMPLEYYFDLHAVPREYLHGEIDPGGRWIVVVNESRQETLAKVLSELGLEDADPASARVLRRYDSASLYEMAPAQ